MYNSLAQFYTTSEFELYVFCFDEDSKAYFKGQQRSNIKAIGLSELELALPQLPAVKTTRSFVEYFFTSTPAICKYVFQKFEHVDELVYLDADLLFFQSPEILFKEIQPYSVSIIAHKFNWINYFRNIFGKYNVGWVSFKRDENGIACLESWFNNNINWCYDKLTLTKYADQKYLNYWQRDFDGVYVIQNKGANVAPWNVGNYKITIDNSLVCIDNQPLVFYHFASLKLIDNKYYTTISSYFSKVTPTIKSHIYQPYISALIHLGFKPRVSPRLNQNPIINKIRKLMRNFFDDNITP